MNVLTPLPKDRHWLDGPITWVRIVVHICLPVIIIYAISSIMGGGSVRSEFIESGVRFIGVVYLAFGAIYILLAFLRGRVYVVEINERFRYFLRDGDELTQAGPGEYWCKKRSQLVCLSPNMELVEEIEPKRLGRRIVFNVIFVDDIRIESATAFFEWYSRLKECGGDFAKVHAHLLSGWHECGLFNINIRTRG